MSDTTGISFDLIYKGPDLLRADRTFSMGAVFGVIQTIGQFIGAQLRRRFHETGVGPKWMRVTVKIDWVSGPSDFPVVQILDRQNRAVAVKRSKR